MRQSEAYRAIFVPKTRDLTWKTVRCGHAAFEKTSTLKHDALTRRVASAEADKKFDMRVCSSHISNCELPIWARHSGAGIMWISDLFGDLLSRTFLSTFRCFD